ncbi:MAG: spore maturation protein A [Clostridia bacterium]|nr:spore maturation protein A [Clostridia bacterium]
MNYIWVAIIIFSFFSAIATNNMSELSTSIISGGSDAITLIVKLIGIICFWNGIMAIAEKSGFTTLLCKVFQPFFKFLFPDIRDKNTKDAISMNITANLLGLGNAATPLGLEAMKRMQEHNPNKDTATDNMVKFVVINTAALHLIPTSIAFLRQDYGSKNSMEIILPALITSVLSLTIGISLTFLLKKVFK